MTTIALAIGWWMPHALAQSSPAPSTVTVDSVQTTPAGFEVSLNVHVESSDHQRLAGDGATITLKENGHTLAQSQTYGGNGGFTRDFATGTHNIVVEFAGDSNLAPAAGSGTIVAEAIPLFSNIGKADWNYMCHEASSCTTAVIGAGTGLSIKMAHFTGTQHASPTHPAPTGNAELLVDGHGIWTYRADGGAPNAYDTYADVLYTIQGLQPGEHLIMTRYAGDQYFTGAESSMRVVVNGGGSSGSGHESSAQPTPGDSTTNPAPVQPVSPVGSTAADPIASASASAGVSGSSTPVDSAGIGDTSASTRAAGAALADATSARKRSRGPLVPAAALFAIALAAVVVNSKWLRP